MDLVIKIALWVCLAIAGIYLLDPRAYPDDKDNG